MLDKDVLLIIVLEQEPFNPLSKVLLLREILALDACVLALARQLLADRRAAEDPAMRGADPRVQELVSVRVLRMPRCVIDEHLGRREKIS